MANEGFDTVIFTGGGSIVLSAGIESLTFAQVTGNIGGLGGADNNFLEGNNGANILDGGAGNDTLKGYAGEDILLGGSGNDRLDGGKGADRMEGGTGDDTYLVDNANDQIIEAAASGTDTVRSWLKNTTLGDNLENLILEGTAKANGTGNDLANSLTGNAKANILTGGAGADTFVFNTALGPMNVDTITDFTTGSDKIALDHTLFGSLSGGWFHSVTNLNETDADDHILYDQSTGALYYDADASGVGAAVRFAMVSGMPAVSVTDMLVV
jgi:Ca2+-binding RTX toxin-like protein